MQSRHGLQVIRYGEGFALVFKTKDSRYINLLDEMPRDFTPTIWKSVKDKSFSCVRDWVNRDSCGIIVYEGMYYEFDEIDRTSPKDWPPNVRKAYAWLKEIVLKKKVHTIH